MKTLPRYLLGQVIASLLMTVAVFTFVLLLGSALRELLPLLISQRATVGLLAKALGLLIPFVGAFALPIGMLTATLLVFGRFSADQELTAARASGVSLVSLLKPILVLSILLCGVSALMNLEVAPRCRVAFKELLFDVRAAVTSMQLPEGRFIKMPNYIVYVGRNRRQGLQNILVYGLKDETNLEYTVSAPRGELQRDAQNQKMILQLYEANIVRADPSGPKPGFYDNVEVPLDFSSAQKSMGDPSIDDMTLEQLKDELRLLERHVNFRGAIERKAADEMRAQQLALAKTRDNLTEPVRIEIHRKVAFSFACFGFTLVGIPLGIRMHRRETNIGVAIALLLVAVYYTLMITGQSLSTRPEWAPHLLMWLPNIVFQAAGVVLLWRANRGR